MIFLVGDVQGCAQALERLLSEIDFSPSRDRLVVLGDMVNRGPDSLRVLQRLAALGGAAVCLLGNHDLHMLAVAYGVRQLQRGDTFRDVLQAPDSALWIDWLRQQRLACMQEGWLCVHAGALPQWSVADTLARAAEIEAVLRGPDLGDFLPQMYGNEPREWDESLQGAPRLRLIINALTRMRFCTPTGRLDFSVKEGVNAAPPGHMPWFEVAGRLTAGQPIAFGHWSMLGKDHPADLLALDTGCVWGGCLTAARIDGGRCDLTQIHCEQQQVPGPGV